MKTAVGPVPIRLTALLRRALFLGTVALALVMAPAMPAHAQAQVTDEEVGQMIDALVKYIFSLKSPEGNWEQGRSGHAYNSGQTALVVTALLYAGVSPQDERLARPLRHLRETELQGAYEGGLHAHVWGATSEQVGGQHLDRTFRFLQEFRRADTTAGYTPSRTERETDHSNTQYHLLGVWEAAKRGRTMAPQFWSAVINHWIRAQNDSGTWGYGHYASREGSRTRNQDTMTLAGLTALLIAQQEALRDRGQPEPRVTASINRGLAWVDSNFSGYRNGYLAVSYERVALANGRRYFGNTDWFVQGARSLRSDMRGMRPDHPEGMDSFTGSGRGRIVESSFALMFLSRGRVPVWATKLEVPGVAWNNRPNDLYFLTQALSDLREQELSFYTANLARPADELIDTPILYFSAGREFELTPEQTANLRRYIDLGGMLVLNNEGGSSGFEHSAEDLVAKLFPGRALEPAPADHPLFRSLFNIESGGRHARILSNGVRDKVIFFNQDVGMAWQADRNLLKPDNRSDVGRLAANLFVLATNRGSIPNRLVNRVEVRDRRVDVRHKVTIARPRYEGNWLPEAGAWVAVGNRLHNQRGVHVVTTSSGWETPAELEIPERNRGRNQGMLAEIEGEVVDLSALDQSRAQLAHLTGTDEVRFSSAELQAMVNYVSNGGTILVETVGGHGGFAGGVSRQITEFLAGVPDHQFMPARALPLGLESSVISGEGVEGYDASMISFRRFTQVRLNLPARPRLMAIDHDGRPAIIFSEEDLSLGAMGVPRWGILGYSPEDAQKLMGNIVLTALNARGQMAQAD
ncbi:MAG: DUF4159 domain-containing protein [Phycisphaeraceae bacterium]|nr:DUF4159 domain-containing protein [Phycisphaeraceae bacterium]